MERIRTYIAYTLEDLIRAKKIKNSKLEIVYQPTGETYLAEVENMFIDNWRFLNSAEVYIPALRKKCKAYIKPKNLKKDDELWHLYHEYVPFANESLHNIKDANKREYMINTAVEFCKQFENKFNLVFMSVDEYSVDAEPDKNGRYTVTAIGRCKHNNRNMRFYRVFDKYIGIEQWEFVLIVNARCNDFTNVSVRKEKPVFDKSIPIVDFTETYEKFINVKSEIQGAIKKALNNGGITYFREGNMFMQNQDELDKILEKAKKDLWELNVCIKFDNIVYDTLHGIDGDKRKVYFGTYGDDESFYSYNKLDVKEYLESHGKELEEFGCNKEYIEFIQATNI